MLEAMSTSSDSDLPLVLNAPFFKIIIKPEDDPLEPSKQIRAECQLCPSRTTISGSRSATGNFYTHLRVSIIKLGTVLIEPSKYLVVIPITAFAIFTYILIRYELLTLLFND